MLHVILALYYHLNGVSGGRINEEWQSLDAQVPCLTSNAHCLQSSDRKKLSLHSRYDTTLWNTGEHCTELTCLYHHIYSCINWSILSLFCPCLSRYCSFMGLDSFFAQTFIPWTHYHPCTSSAYTNLSRQIMQWTLTENSGQTSMDIEKHFFGWRCHRPWGSPHSKATIWHTTVWRPKTWYFTSES